MAAAAAAAKSTTKTGIIWNIVCVIVCALFIPFIICSLYLSVETRKNPDRLATVFGTAPVVVLSGSMEPVFKVNDLIFIEDVDVNALQEKDIICFYDEGSFVTHRISRIVIEEGEKRFYTMGDFNGAEDKDYVVASQIQGKYTGRIPKLGGVILFIQDPYGLVLTLILLLLLFITGELIIEILEKRKTNKLLLAELEKLRALLAEKELRLGEKEAVVAAQEKQLKEQAAWLAEQESLLTERERRLVEQEKRLIDQEGWLAAFLPKPEELAPLPTQMDEPRVEELTVTTEATEEVVEETAVTTEATEEVVEESAVIAEATEEVFDETAVATEATEEVVEESAVTTEVTEEVVEESALIAEATEEVVEESAVIAEATEEVLEETAVTTEATETVAEAESELTESKATIKLRKIAARRLKILFLEKEKPTENARKDTVRARFLKK